jgi:rhomboid protease GluP
MADGPDTLRETARVALQRTSQRELADEWALVLMSQGLHPNVRHDAGTWVLSVPLEEAAPAAAAVASYLHENPAPLEREPEPGDADWLGGDGDGLPAALLVSASLIAFFLVTGPRDAEVAWFAQGSADAAKLVGGEWWRSVTALTLHADLVHVLSNAILGALLLSALCSMLGSGLALSLVLLSGALGNALNAALQAGQHVSVGASTAVFGALGILAAFAIVRRRRIGERGRRLVVPVAAGLGLLAMLGTGGERVDLWAHLLGFVAGTAVGGLASTLRLPARAAHRQAQLGLLAIVTVVGCWQLALH